MMQLEEDVMVSSFDNSELLLDEVVRVLSDNDDSEISPIYLLSCDQDISKQTVYIANVHVTDDDDNILALMNEMLDALGSFDLTFHLHEYGSYEDAYKVALDMMQGHPLCYQQD